MTLMPSGTTRLITLTASADVFDILQIGARFRTANKEVKITGVTNATITQAITKEILSPISAVKDWEEQSYLNYRGLPVSICFHQDILVISGS